MKCKIYLKSDELTCNNDYSNYYASPESYIEALKQSTMDFNNLSVKTKKIQENVSFSSCICNLYNELSENELFNAICSKSLSKVNISLAIDTMEEDFEYQIKDWLKNSYFIINSRIQKQQKNKYMALEDFIIEFSFNDKLYKFIFKQCQFVNYINDHTFTISISEINEI